MGKEICVNVTTASSNCLAEFMQAQVYGSSSLRLEDGAVSKHY